MKRCGIKNYYMRRFALLYSIRGKSQKFVSFLQIKSMFIKIVVFILLLITNGFIYFLFNTKERQVKMYLLFSLIIFLLIVSVKMISVYAVSELVSKILIFHSVALIIFNLLVPLMLKAFRALGSEIEINKVLLDSMESILNIISKKIIFILTVIYQFLLVFLLKIK